MIGSVCGSHSARRWPFSTRPSGGDQQARAVGQPVARLLAAGVVVQHELGGAPEHHVALLAVDHQVGVDQLQVPSTVASTLERSACDCAAPPMWKVRMVSWVPGSPMLCAAITPTASPTLTGVPRARSRP